MAKSRGLTVKQIKFCEKYIECGNASDAYRYAYDCQKSKPATINSKAFHLLRQANISAMMNRLRFNLQNNSEITKDRILKELEAILDAKITDYIDLTTKEIDTRTAEQVIAGVPPRLVQVQELIFKDFSQLNENQIKAIESVKTTKTGIELKLHGKSWTIERICKMLGFDAPQKVAQTDSAGNDVDRPLSPERRAEILKEAGVCK